MGAKGPAWLFVPGDQPERFAKAVAAADLAIIDLEDAVRAEDKAGAREALAAAELLDPRQICVRINGFGTDHIEADLALVRALGIGTVMLPMAESDQPFDSLDGLTVIALVETARGVMEAAHIAAHPHVSALALGSADLQLDLRGRSRPDSHARFDDLLGFARAQLLFAARAADIAVIDSVHIALDDAPGLAREAAVAAIYGFDGKLAIHPTQVQAVRTAFAPTPDELGWARTVVAEARSRSEGAFALDGELIDEVVIRRAEMLLRFTS
nr:CoA ester lyase [Brevibacterium marinum]